MVLLKFFPQEIVDMIYLRTDFFTAIKHIPNNKFVLEALFYRDIERPRGISEKWRDRGNSVSISMYLLLKKGCEASLRYFKEKKPHAGIRYSMFKFDSFGKIDRTIEWNDLLIKVYNLTREDILYYENKLFLCGSF
jgi:hypothetical protein